MAKLQLSVAFNAMSGKAGTVVVAKTKDGYVMRPRTIPTNPKTPDQQAARARFRTAASTFKGLTKAQGEAWQRYANGLYASDPIDGIADKRRAMSTFTGLASKFLQVNPGGTIPVDPPTESFEGDTLTFTTLPSGSDVTVTANGANGADTTTEFLAQPLASVHVTPQPEAYKHVTFKAFTADPGGNSVTLNLGPGVWSIAYRYVDTATGQSTGLVELVETTLSLALEKGKAKKKAA